MSFDYRSSARSRREKEKARRNADILDAAERVFQRRSYSLATMEEIAREAGFAVGTLYNIFQDKQDLYGQVIARIGHALFARLEQMVFKERDPERALEALIKLRLCNYVTDRLFFEAFQYPPELGVQPDPEQLDASVVKMYRRYLATVEQLFRRVASPKGKLRAPEEPRMALSLEGIVTAFMGFWAGPRQSDSLVVTARQIKDMLLRGVMGGDGGAGADRGADDGGTTREIHITALDMERLRELIAVARAFGKKDSHGHLDALDAGLVRARVVHSREVPSDLVTMNSKVRLKDLDTGQMSIRLLVFPKDAELREENVSILSPLGTALLGYRLGDTVAANIGGQPVRLQIEEILYQPEAAGDYHL